jgi:hypothetical protein
MTINSTQLSKIVSHYIENRQSKVNKLDFLVEALTTGIDIEGEILIEDYGSLGKGFYVNGHGSYICSTEHCGVSFLKAI